MQKAPPLAAGRAPPWAGSPAPPPRPAPPRRALDGFLSLLHNPPLSWAPAPLRSAPQGEPRSVFPGDRDLVVGPGGRAGGEARSRSEELPPKLGTGAPAPGKDWPSTQELAVAGCRNLLLLPGGDGQTASLGEEDGPCLGHCRGDPSGPGEPSKGPGGPVGKGRGAKARVCWDRKAGGLRTPGPSLPLSGTVAARGWGSAGLEAAEGETRSGQKPEGAMPPKVWSGAFSPLTGLAPLAHLGPRQRPATPWGRAVVGALAVGLLACLFMLCSIQGRLEILREELAGLRREMRCEAAGTAEDQGAPDPQQRADGGPVPHALRARWKRDVGKSLQEQPSRQRRRHSVLHLVPTRRSNNEEDGGTEIWWAPFLHQGQALEASGQDVLVKHTGLYFVYSQVLFHDPTFTMGQVLRRVAPGKPDQILFRCIQSMPHKLEKAYNSCYSGGVFHLQQGDRLSLRIPRFNASFDISAHGTFLGVLLL